ncbi:hypothetical protein Q2T41_14050 [Maribacter confluentis]|uniref:Uncharacterized protein n=1 Tax=Maribacter confluentis TaxID=1656093 RepID=A0ABT8RUN1_9FLAO|nr:hypothetical protein [Maribacter confluentis]MDO1513781.1 hypothetical protein [Maribacter confluentis]
MNAKWCVSTLIIILAVLGLSQGHTKASNQQISLQFTDVELASDTAHDEVVATITRKLNVLGVEAIEIIENDGTQVSIRYYSDMDAPSVKAFLTQENLGDSSSGDRLPIDFPKEKIPEEYKLVVSDLHQQGDTVVVLNGNLVPVQKQEITDLFNPVVLNFNAQIVLEQGIVEHTAYKINKDIAIAIDQTFQNIPEVRAGPYNNANS